MLPRGRILNTLACAKNVDILTKKKQQTPKGILRAQQSDRNAHKNAGCVGCLGEGGARGMDKQHSEKD